MAVHNALRIITVTMMALASAVQGFAQANDARVQSPHAQWLSDHASKPVRADATALAAPGQDDPASPTVGASTVASCWTVFGFLPYWESPTAASWDVMTHLACFGVEINSSGAVTNARGWPWTSTINTARSRGVTVLLTVILFDDAAIKSLVTSTAAQTALATNLANQINGRADGVVLDFEGTNSTNWAQLMPGFITALRSNMTARLGWTPQIFVASPAVNWSGGWNFRSVAEVSDGLFIMGYDFYGSWSSTSGPSAPLTGGSFNVTNTVQSQYAAARAAVPHKLILGMPFYGNQWRTTGSAAYAPVSSYVGSVVYSSAASLVTQWGRSWDATSHTPYVRWNSAGQWNQVWFDDADSVTAKVNLAKSSRLGGVGMWAVGYEDSRTELWSAIGSTLATGCPCAADITGPGGPPVRPDGQLTIEDFLTFLTEFGDGAGCPAVGPCNRADITGPGGLPVMPDGVLTIEDFLGFLTVFGEGCP